jgi:hypothetical protein
MTRLQSALHEEIRDRLALCRHARGLHLRHARIAHLRIALAARKALRRI